MSKSKIKSIKLKFIEEETFWGEPIKTPEQFIADICNRINYAYNFITELTVKESQRNALLGFFRALRGRLNRVCASF